MHFHIYSSLTVPLSGLDLRWSSFSYFFPTPSISWILLHCHSPRFSWSSQWPPSWNLLLLLKHSSLYISLDMPKPMHIYSYLFFHHIYMSLTSTFTKLQKPRSYLIFLDFCGNIHLSICNGCNVILQIWRFGCRILWLKFCICKCDVFYFKWLLNIYFICNVLYGHLFISRGEVDSSGSLTRTGVALGVGVGVGGRLLPLSTWSHKFIC